MVEAFEQVYRAYFGDVHRYALRLTQGDSALADDITSDAFMKAMRSIHTFRGECALGTWLRRIARNCYLDHLRRHRRLAGPEALEQVPDDTDLEERFAIADQALRAHQALHSLSEPYREVFSLRVLGGLSFRDIGKLFAKTDNWACVTYHRARKQLLEKLEEEDEH